MRKLGALIVLFVLASALVAVADTADTCKDLGFTNLTSSTSGEWGSVDFSDTEPTLTLTVLEGFEVRLCVKAGSAQQGLGPELTDWHGEGEYTVAHSSGKDLSHYGYEVRQIPDDPTTTEGTSSTTQDTTTTSLSVTTTEPSTTTSTAPGSTTTIPETTTTEPPISSTTSSPVSSTVPSTSTTLSAPTTVPTGPSELPFTGAEDAVPLGLWAFAAVALGSLMVWSARHARTEDR